MKRREWLKTAALGIAGILGTRQAQAEGAKKAQIAITLDLEMSRNFPKWEDTRWDFEKGNLDEAAKRYSLAAAEKVRAAGGRIHFFCVGQVLEQPNVDWLQTIAKAGYPIGNHTYDHVYLLAKTNAELQYRFQRAPWLIEGKETADVIRENIRLTTLAMKQRLGVENRGFRTPGGFVNGLHGREDLQQMLLDLGFTWVSSLYPGHGNTKPKEQPTEEVFQSIIDAQAKAQPFVYPSGLVEVPMSPISDIGAFRSGQWELEWFLEAVRRAVTWAIERRAVFDFLAHPSCLGVVDPKLRTMELICNLVKAAGDAAEFVDLDRIATSLKSPPVG